MRLALAPAVLAVALVAGCGSNTPAPLATDLPIELKPVTVAELDGFIAAQKGNVLLIDCWFLG